MSEWISVDERLPDGLTDVLVAGYQQGMCAVAYIVLGDWKPVNVDCMANEQIYLDFTPTH